MVKHKEAFFVADIRIISVVLIICAQDSRLLSILKMLTIVPDIRSFGFLGNIITRLDNFLLTVTIFALCRTVWLCAHPPETFFEGFHPQPLCTHLTNRPVGVLSSTNLLLVEVICAQCLIYERIFHLECYLSHMLGYHCPLYPGG